MKAFSFKKNSKKISKKNFRFLFPLFFLTDDLCPSDPASKRLQYTAENFTAEETACALYGEIF